ncbi:hypothetical protein DW080_07155 [Bacteroides caccae]|nr:hypothetical protein DW080_07155 [Bacteroides caccae]RYU03731.1 hypothetical protein EAJ00_12265 [Bacteroides caccae]
MLRLRLDNGQNSLFCGFRYSFAHVNSGKTAGKNRNCVIKPKYNMSPFVIFVIVLTIIYIIYYAVMITRDLYGKKEDHKTQEEVFDVSDMVEEEAAVSVHESDNGFSVADKEYETLNLHDENEAPSSTDGESGDAKSEKQSPKNVAENLAHKFEKKSDEIQPSMSDGMYADDFYQTLLNGNRTNRPQIKIEHIRNEL